jgi:hypothetical protein
MKSKTLKKKKLAKKDSIKFLIKRVEKGTDSLIWNYYFKVREPIPPFVKEIHSP